MEKSDLKNNLIRTLARMYDKESFGILMIFFQGENRVLLYLSEHPDMDVYSSLISDKLHVSRSRVTAILTMLRKKGYVTLKMSENDRRGMLIKITAEGLAFIREKQKWAERYFEILVDGLGEENTVELTRLVKISADIMEKKSLENGDCKRK